MTNKVAIRDRDWYQYLYVTASVCDNSLVLTQPGKSRVTLNHPNRRQVLEGFYSMGFLVDWDLYHDELAESTEDEKLGAWESLLYALTMCGGNISLNNREVYPIEMASMNIGEFQCYLRSLPPAPLEIDALARAKELLAEAEFWANSAGQGKMTTALDEFLSRLS